MKILRELPRRVREIEHEPIVMRDDVRLSARIWLPEGAERRPVPALLEALPYRKRAGTRLRDEPIHRYFAGHGFASLRLDLRGTGESEGVLRDEYSEEEREDILEVLRWVAARPWCDGAVGMFGKSWGGINALQVAALRPPELRAIVTVCSTDDRFRRDAHYEGGALLNENLTWGSALMLQAAYPPDPAIVGERWEAMWRERLEALPFFPARWLRHGWRDPYWGRGSVADDLSRIRVPVLAVGGWADPYCTTVLHLLAGLETPCEGWIGPWAHLYPHDGVPGPPAGFLQECVDWWRRWLSP
ncbi:MAG: CocE/NonD family hydrolase, partial [Gemmatimonadota bacterium]